MSEEEGKSVKTLNGSVKSPIMKKVIEEKALASPEMAVVPTPQDDGQAGGQASTGDTTGGDESQGDGGSGKDK